MFESAELGRFVKKKQYEKDAPRIRAALLEAQRQLAESDRSLLVIVSGVEGAGKSETVNLLLEWMDARGIQTHAMGAQTEEDEQHPELWRFWRALPRTGRTGIFFGSWYTAPVVSRVFDRIDDARFDQELERIVELERMLGNERMVLVKLWMHLSKKAQKARLHALESDPLQSWRVERRDWKYFKQYDRFRKISERALRRTDTAEAPWHIIEAEDHRYRSLTATRTLLQAIKGALKKAKAAPAAPAEKPPLPVPKQIDLLNRLDLSRALDKDTYEKKLPLLERELNLLTRELRESGRSLVLVFEGPDAAGKGGAIRRLTQAMDARQYEVTSTAAPTDEERGHPYLWRFWRHIPRRGRVAIFDRSWYGRVLVERIEGFCAPADWRRAYAEINSFEEQLHGSGIVVVKFWLAISAEEQLQRFKDRQTTPYKQYKITEEDWRNRAKWNAYEAAACEMFERTSTAEAPWVLVEANDKQWARIKVLKSVVKALRRSS